MKQHLTILALAAGLGVSLTAQASLMGRDLDGIAATYEAYYDDQLMITWLADANYAQTSGYDADGLMNWAAANAWAAGLNYYGITGWRLPTMAPANASNVFSNNGTTSGGYGATGTGWGLPTDADGIWSELGWMYYHNLANLGGCTPNDASPGTCITQAGYGLVDGAALDDETLFNGTIQDYPYWSDIDALIISPAGVAWDFDFRDGRQRHEGKLALVYAWAVRDGDVAAVPEPHSLALLGLGLGGLGWARRRG